MKRNTLDFPNSSRLADLGLNLGRLFDILPEGWVFVGVMRRAGVEYSVGPENERWIAIATLESPIQLGPIPELRGTGRDIVEALIDLRVNLAEGFGIDDPTARFGADALTEGEASVESTHDS